MSKEQINVLLRSWKESDVERLAEIANSEKVFNNFRDSFPHPYTIENAKKFISINLAPDQYSAEFAIECDGIVVGSIGATIKSDIYKKNAEVGFFVDENYSGKGIGTIALKIMVNYLFENYDVIRIFAEVFKRNQGSRRVLEKAGFKLEANFHCNVCKNGVIEDSIIYSLLKKNKKY